MAVQLAPGGRVEFGPVAVPWTEWARPARVSASSALQAGNRHRGGPLLGQLAGPGAPLRLSSLSLVKCLSFPSDNLLALF